MSSPAVHKHVAAVAVWSQEAIAHAWVVPLHESVLLHLALPIFRVRHCRHRQLTVTSGAAVESFFSSLKTERTARKTYRTRDEAKADVFDYIECFYNPKRRHSTIGYLSPVEFEMQAGFA